MAKFNKDSGSLGLHVSSFCEAWEREDEKGWYCKELQSYIKNCQLYVILLHMAWAENGYFIVTGGTVKRSN